MLKKMTISSSVKVSVVAMVAICCMSIAAQQSTRQMTASAVNQQSQRMQVELGFTSADADLAGTTNTFWLSGGNAEFASRIYQNLGVAVNFQGLETGNTGNGVGLNLITVTAGPRFSWTPQSSSVHKTTIFGEGLAGFAHGYNSLFPASPSATATANSLAVEANGGLDVALSPFFSIRLAQIGWLRTALPNSTGNNIQNDFHVGAGIVLHSRN